MVRSFTPRDGDVHASPPPGWTILVCLAAGIGGALLAWFRPQIALAVVQRNGGSPSWVQRVEALDPRVGRIYHLPTVHDLRGRPTATLDPDRPTRLLIVRYCRSCGVETMLRELQARGANPRGPAVRAVVVRGNPREVASYWASRRLSVPVLLDRDGQLARCLNAVFGYRTYLLEPNGRLLYLSAFDERRAEIDRNIEAALAGINR